MKVNSKKSVRRGARVSILVVVFCGIVSLVPSLRAEDDAAPAQAGRAVRLSSVDGDVHLSHGDTVLADQAVANTPLFEGTHIETGAEGRAEIQFEDGSVARVSPQSALTLSILRGGNGDRDTEVLLNNGLGYFEVQGEDAHSMRVRFGDAVITTSGFTVLRVNLDKAPGEVAVFSGNAHLEGGSAPALDLHGGQSLTLNAADPNNYNVADSIEPDSWDAWNSDRDQELTTAAANRTDATETLPDNKNPAWSDLDANGNWYNVPDQGYVWSPYEASSQDWDPYGNGYWMNTPGYGYAWVSGEPWGYLPFQCGAWNYYNSFGWGWAPGVCSPWWGNTSGWVINIGIAPPRYRYPVRPPRPRNPRPMEARAPMIPVHRRLPPATGISALHDRRGPVTIASNVVQPLRPIQQTRVRYNEQAPVYGVRTGPEVPRSLPSTLPANGYQGGSTPRPGVTPVRPGGTYIPPQPRPGGVYAPAPPRPSTPTYTRPAAPPPVRMAPPPPMRSAPPPPPPASHPSGGGGGGGGAPHPAGGPHH